MPLLSARKCKQPAINLLCLLSLCSWSRIDEPSSPFPSTRYVLVGFQSRGTVHTLQQVLQSSEIDRLQYETGESTLQYVVVLMFMQGSRHSEDGNLRGYCRMHCRPVGLCRGRRIFFNLSNTFGSGETVADWHSARGNNVSSHSVIASGAVKLTASP